MKNPLLVPEIRELLASPNPEDLRAFCEAAHPATIAEFLAALEPEEIWQALARLDGDLAVEIFDHFDDDTQVAVVEPLTRQELARLVTRMAPDDRVDLLKRIPEEKQHALLQALARAEREDIRRLSSYEEGTAGSVMTTEYATLPPSLTAREAIEKLRVEAPDKETIYYAYVVDEGRKLLGFVSLKDLILAPPNSRVVDLMHQDVIAVQAEDDQETAARTLSKYDVLAIPVVNGEGTLVGIITHDDAMDVLTQENTEDMEKIMAIAGAHEAAAYSRTPVLTHFRNRCGWIVVLAILGFAAGFIVHFFEDMLVEITILATFIPMVADTGGNTGSQSATLVVRALALGEITWRDMPRIVFKEARVAAMLACVLAILTFVRVVIFGQGSPLPGDLTLARVAVAVSIALGLQVISSTVIGALLPLGASKLKLDPAVVASPALTTVVDITGLLVFFGTAKVLLGPFMQ